MNTRLLIIIGIIIAIGSVTAILAMNFSEDKKTTVSDTSPKQLEAIMEYCIDSKVLVDTVGLSYYNETHSIDTITCEWQKHERIQIDSEGFDANWIGDEDYCQEWCDQNELYNLGCDQPILAHLTKYSNLLDEEFDGTFNMDWMGLPNDVSIEQFEICVDIIFEKRLSSNIWNFESLNKMILFEDPFFTDPDKFVEISEKKDSKCFTTPSMNYFCYAKPRMYETGIGVSWIISNTTKISGELHFDNVNVGPSYFTMKNMTLLKGDAAKITFADKDYRVGNTTTTLYEIHDDFEFTEIIEKFDTFVAKCDNYDGTSVTVVQYLGITTIDDVDYFMTWHTNALSEAGIACDYPQIIQNSFDNDFGNIGHDWEIDSEPEFEVQREIAKQIYKSLPKNDDSPYLGMRLGDDRKSIQFGMDITKLTPEKNKEYYEKLFEEKFSEVISYKVVFKERQGGDE